MSDETKVQEVKADETPHWAKLICPFLSTTLPVMQPGLNIQGLGSTRPQFGAVNAHVPCVGPRCAIFYSCQPGGVQEQKPTEGGEEPTE